MKTNMIIILILTYSLNLMAKCNTQAIGYVNKSGFGISFGGGEVSAGSYDKNVTNVPLTINGKAACFKKKSAYDLKLETNADDHGVPDKKAKTNITLAPAEVEFENVPNAHFKHYIMANPDPRTGLMTFSSMLFICSGEFPISVEGTRDTSVSLEVKKIQSNSVHTSSSFATGIAAQNLSQDMVSDSHEEIVFKEFTKFFQEIKPTVATSPDITQPCCQDVHVPSLLTSSNVTALVGIEKNIVKRLTTLKGDFPNGCSTEFHSAMKNYLFEHIESNPSLKSMTVEKKWFSNKYTLEY